MQPRADRSEPIALAFNHHVPHQLIALTHERQVVERIIVDLGCRSRMRLLPRRRFVSHPAIDPWRDGGEVAQVELCLLSIRQADRQYFCLFTHQRRIGLYQGDFSIRRVSQKRGQGTRGGALQRLAVLGGFKGEQLRSCADGCIERRFRCGTPPHHKQR
ncbi:hypothetical protein D3C76_1311620 [compost metagenome]